MNVTAKVDDCQIIDLGKIHNRAGNITIIEGNRIIPFSVKRVYYLYDVPAGAERGGHAHKCLFQLIVAVSGSFEVILYDGHQKRTIKLNRPFYGLIVVPGIWREIINFSSGSNCLVLASDLYNEKDYIRIYDEFLNYKTMNESSR
jgi:hypothetical protein